MRVRVLGHWGEHSIGLAEGKAIPATAGSAGSIVDAYRYDGYGDTLDAFTASSPRSFRSASWKQTQRAAPQSSSSKSGHAAISIPWFSGEASDHQ